MALLKIRQHTKAWHNIRRHYIGGSEIAVLFGLGEPYQGNLWTLTHEKSGKVPTYTTAPSVRTELGLAWESAVASGLHRLRHWSIQKGRYAINDNIEVVIDGVKKGGAASLDFEITNPGPDALGVEAGGYVLKGSDGPLIGPGVLQVKTCAYDIYKNKWHRPDGEPEPPYSIVLQVQHEIACAGYKWGVVALVLGANDLKLFFYQAHPGLIDWIEGEIRSFWSRIRDGIEPDPATLTAGERTDWALNHLYSTAKQDLTLDMSGNNEWPELCAKWAKATSDRVAAEKIEKDMKTRARALMGQAAFAYGGGWEVKANWVAAQEGRVAKPGEIIGAKKAYPILTVREAA